MTEQELQRRILEGHRRINQLCEIADRLPKGVRRDEIGEKSIRLLQSLHDLEDGFCELYPQICLFVEKRCYDVNKGTFICGGCVSYLKAFCAVEQVKLI